MMKRQNMFQLFMFAFMVLSVKTESLFAQIDSFTVVGVHPKAAAQPTASGREIVALFPWKGKLYAGYGDYGANTGPISIMAFDPVTRIFTEEWIANTEAVFNYRVIRGKVYAPAIDRRLYSEPGDYTILDTTGIWSNQNCGSTTHAYDVVSLTNKDIWIVGSQDVNAAAFRSTDDGKTWKTALRDTAISGKSGDFSRFYFAGVLDGKLYVQARDYYGSLHPTSKVFDGNQWSDGPDLFPGSRGSLGCRPDNFAGKLLYRTWQMGQSSRLFVFDGSSAKWLDSMWVFDVAIDSGYCYALVDSGYGTITVKRTNDLRTWTRLVRVPVGSKSLAVLNGKIYIGTNDSRLLEFVPSVTTVRDQSSSNIAYPLVHVYPNPTTDRIYINVQNGMEEVDVRLIDLFGRELFRTTRDVTGSIVLNLQSYTTGIYFVVARNGNRNNVTTVIRH